MIINELINEAVENDPALCPNGCGHSYKGTDRKHNLKKHMVYACGVNPKFQCDVCFKKFVRKQTLKFHLHAKHNRSLTFWYDFLVVLA